MGKRISVELPSAPLKRYKKRQYSKRTWVFDFRGIRCHPPTTAELKRLQGKKQRDYAGERPAFSSPESLQAKVDEYFLSCYEPVVDRAGRLVRDDEGEIVRRQVRPFTVAGLAFAVGFQTNALNRYCSGAMDNLDEDNDDLLYSSILRKAKQRIEVFNEESLYDRDKFNGSRFILDAHYKRITAKESAEIAERLKNMELKERELDMKRELVGEDEDGTLTINIVRKEREEG